MKEDHASATRTHAGDTYRMVVQHLAIAELERRYKKQGRFHKGGDRLITLAAAEPGKELDPTDVQLAKAYALSQHFDFKTDVLFEVARMSAIAATLNPLAKSKWSWLTDIRPRSWMLGLACFLPLLLICLWSVKNLFHVSSLAQPSICQL